jgi:hypothetical protein
MPCLCGSLTEIEKVESKRFLYFDLAQLPDVAALHPATVGRNVG